MEPATIAEYIERDLRARLGAGGGPPEALTLHALSAHYGVSPTPVRHALKALIDQRVLRRRDNGRVEVDPSSIARRPSNAEATAPARPRDAADVEAELTAEVIALGLRGEPVQLREEETAARYGVGRTVLRQVLGRLAGRGLIDHLPRRGWRVRTFDEADLTAYLRVREALEVEALDLARPHLDAREMRAMLLGNRRRPGGGPDRLDNSLHRYLVEKSGNRYLREFFDGPGAYYTALFDYAAPEARVVAAMARQHRLILRAMIAGDWRRARRALTAHIRAQLPIVRAVMTRLGRHRPEPPIDQDPPHDP